jgi:hypothetical protein
VRLASYPEYCIVATWLVKRKLVDLLLAKDYGKVAYIVTSCIYPNIITMHSTWLVRRKLVDLLLAKDYGEVVRIVTS